MLSTLERVMIYTMPAAMARSPVPPMVGMHQRRLIDAFETQEYFFERIKRTNVARFYDLYCQFEEGSVRLPEIDITQYLHPDHAPEEFNVHPVNVRTFGYLDGKRVSTRWNTEDFAYVDAPFVFVLEHQTKKFPSPNALTAFMPDGDICRILQVQGIKKDKLRRKSDGLDVRGLPLLDWRKYLVDYVAAWAKEEGFSRVCLQSGQNNKWVHNGAMTLQRAKQCYDDLALRLGFSIASDSNFYKSI